MSMNILKNMTWRRMFVVCVHQGLFNQLHLCWGESTGQEREIEKLRRKKEKGRGRNREEGWRKHHRTRARVCAPWRTPGPRRMSWLKVWPPHPQTHFRQAAGLVELGQQLKTYRPAPPFSPHTLSFQPTLKALGMRVRKHWGPWADEGSGEEGVASPFRWRVSGSERRGAP